MEFITNIDNSILSFIINNMKNSIFDVILPIITKLGSGAFIWIVVALIFLITKKYRKYGIVLSVALLLCYLVGNVTLKPLISRERPSLLLDSIKLLISVPRDYSFPSGHAMAAFAAMVVIFKANIKYGIAAIILAITIAFSRLYLYVHYPSDVIAGIIIGIIIGFVSLKIFNSKKSI